MLLGLDTSCVTWQADVEGGSPTDFAVDVSKAVVLLDNAINSSQSQTGAFAGFLGCEKRFEQFFEGFLVHSGTIVADDNRHIIAG